MPSPVTTPSTPSAPRSVRRTRSARCGSRSLATNPAPRPAASAASSAALPPGPAQRSSQRRSGPSSGAEARASATSCDPSSCTPARPSATAATAPGSPEARCTPYGDQRVGSPGSSSRVERPGRATSVTPGASLSATSNASISPSPTASASASTTHRGWAWATLEVPDRVVAHVPARPARPTPRSSCSETRRSTAFAKPAAPGPTSERTSATVVLIAACAGTRMASSWWAPRRSASSTRACTFASGRSTQAASTASYRPWRRTVPEVSSVAKAASRPLSPCFLRAAGSARLVYASAARTARSTSSAAVRAGSAKVFLHQLLGGLGRPRVGDDLLELLAGQLAEPRLLHEHGAVAVEVRDREERRRRRPRPGRASRPRSA